MPVFLFNIEKDKPMLPTKMFALRMNAHEKAMLAELAKELHRPQSEVIRLLIRETLIALKSQPVSLADCSNDKLAQKVNFFASQ